MVSTLDKLSNTITDIIKKEYNNSQDNVAAVGISAGTVAPSAGLKVDENGQIYW